MLSPRSYEAGHTRLPTFSMKRKSRSSRAQPSSARSTMAASRWQTVPVVICRTGAPLRASRAASFSVARSPTSAATRHRGRKQRQRPLQQRRLAGARAGDQADHEHARRRGSAAGARGRRRSFCLRMFCRTSTRRGSWLIARSPGRPAPAPGRCSTCGGGSAALGAAERLHALERALGLDRRAEDHDRALPRSPGAIPPAGCRRTPSRTTRAAPRARRRQSAPIRRCNAQHAPAMPARLLLARSTRLIAIESSCMAPARRSAACPRLMPPSFGGTRWLIQRREPLPLEQRRELVEQHGVLEDAARRRHRVRAVRRAQSATRGVAQPVREPGVERPGDLAPVTPPQPVVDHARASSGRQSSSPPSNGQGYGSTGRDARASCSSHIAAWPSKVIGRVNPTSAAAVSNRRPAEVVVKTRVRGLEQPARRLRSARGTRTARRRGRAARRAARGSRRRPAPDAARRRRRRRARPAAGGRPARSPPRMLPAKISPPQIVPSSP